MENNKGQLNNIEQNYEKQTYKRRMTGYLIFAIILTFLVVLIKDLRIDQYMERLITSLLGEGDVAVTQAAVMFAHTEVIIALSIGIIAALIISGLSNWAFLYFRLMFFGSFIAYLLKEVISRPRPTELISANLWQLGTESISQSFPSGHVMKITFLIAFFVILYMVKRKEKLPTGILGIGGILVVLVGLGQVLNGRHFFTDVVGGYFWALAWTYGNLYVESLRKEKGIFGENTITRRSAFVFQRKFSLKGNSGRGL